MHAGLTNDELGRIALERTEPKPWPNECKIGGAVAATAVLADALYVGGCSREGIAAALKRAGIPDEQLRFAFGPTIYVLKDIVALREVVSCRGYQGFFKLPPAVEAKVRAQMTGAA